MEGRLEVISFGPFSKPYPNESMAKVSTYINLNNDHSRMAIYTNMQENNAKEVMVKAHM